MSSRRAVLGLLSVAAFAVSCVWPALPAEAVSTGITVRNAIVVSPPDDVGLLSVDISSSSPLTSMTVSLIQSGVDKLDLPMNAFTVPVNDGNGLLGTWTLQSPITTNQLALGAYDARVAATDSGGDTVSGAEAGTLIFENEVQFPGFTSSGTAFDYDHQAVTFSGTAMLLAPDGTSTPFANETIGLNNPDGSYQAVSTDSAGAFTATVQAQNGAYSMGYPGNTQTEIGYSLSPPISIQVTQSAVTIHARLAKADVNKGAPDSVRGTVTYTDNGVTKPLPHETITLYKGGNPNVTPKASTVTDSAGHFSLPVPTAGNRNPYWSVATKPSPYLGSGLAIVKLTVAKPNAITHFFVSLNSFAVLHYSGCLRSSAGTVVFEYAAKRAGPWHQLGPKPRIAARCRQGGFYFSGKATAKLAGAYYRAFYARTPRWQAASSSKVYLHKFLTKITSFSVTPQNVSRGGHITVSGRLWAQLKSGRWQPDPGRRVIVVFRYHGTWYRYRGEPTTNSAGRFKGTFKVHASSPFFAQYNGDATHFASASKRITVTAAALSSSPARTPIDAIRLATIWSTGH